MCPGFAKATSAPPGSRVTAASTPRGFTHLGPSGAAPRAPNAVAVASTSPTSMKPSQCGRAASDGLLVKLDDFRFVFAEHSGERARRSDVRRAEDIVKNDFISGVS